MLRPNLRPTSAWVALNSKLQPGTTSCMLLFTQPLFGATVTQRKAKARDPSRKTGSQDEREKDCVGGSERKNDQPLDLWWAKLPSGGTWPAYTAKARGLRLISAHTSSSAGKGTVAWLWVPLSERDGWLLLSLPLLSFLLSYFLSLVHFTSLSVIHCLHPTWSVITAWEQIRQFYLSGLNVKPMSKRTKAVVNFYMNTFSLEYNLFKALHWTIKRGTTSS